MYPVYGFSYWPTVEELEDIVGRNWEKGWDEGFDRPLHSARDCLLEAQHRKNKRRTEKDLEKCGIKPNKARRYETGWYFLLRNKETEQYVV